MHFLEAISIIIVVLLDYAFQTYTCISDQYHNFHKDS